MAKEEKWASKPVKEEANWSEQPGPEHLEVLTTRFGHSSFRPMQWRIIQSIIEQRRDNCVIMATGYGKSLTYQFPSVFLDRLTFVVSPLISLMEDQVLSLNLYNIPACLLGTAQRANLLPDIEAGAFRVVYLTPEYITGDSGLALLKAVESQLALIAIDEAHCLSKWGHDFRPAYRNLGIIRRTCPKVPILAVTATATPKVRDDIVRSLALVNPQILCTGFDRPNLEFIVRPKGPQGPLEDIKPLLAANREGSVIIYCLTRKQTDEVVELLRTKGIVCEAYHAGLSIKQRREVHESFVRDRVQIIVATIAFGMGIDKPDVRLVIHYGASKDLESYYQEAGRAGRDGQPSRCVMFWSRADFKTHEFLRSNSQGAVQNNLEQLSRKMSEYLDTRDCRRRFILQYFEGSLAQVDKPSEKLAAGKKCCDNCTRGGLAKDCERYEGIDAEGRYNFAAEAEMLLNAIGAFYGGTGFALPIMLLRGSKNKKLGEKHYTNPLFGKGKAKDEEWWKSLGALLEREGYLNKVKIPNTFNKFAVIYNVQITPAGRKWLNSDAKDRKLMLKPTAEMFKSLRVIKPLSLYDPSLPSQPTQERGVLPQSKSSALQNLTQELVKSLLIKRSELATTFECMPYMIASNAALHQMASRKPLNLKEMKEAHLDGFSDAKLQKFGWEFLVCIQQKLNLLPSPGETVAVAPAAPSVGSLSATQSVTLSLWRTDHKSVSEIAAIRKLVESTIINHLCDAIRAGVPFHDADLERLGIGKNLYATIARHLPANLNEPHTLTSVKEKCPPEVSFNQLKIVLAVERQRRLCPNPPDGDALASSSSTQEVAKNATESNKAATFDAMFDDDNEDMLNLVELDHPKISQVTEKPSSEQSPPLKDIPRGLVTSPAVSHVSVPSPTDQGNDLGQKKATPPGEHKKGAFVMKTPTRGRPVNLKRILYEDDDSDKEDRDDNGMSSFRLPKRKP